MGRSPPVGMGVARSALIEPGTDVGDDLYQMVYRTALFDQTYL